MSQIASSSDSHVPQGVCQGGVPEVNEESRVAVIGAGSWGTALASILADKLPEVTLWCREQEVADSIAQQRRNPYFLSDTLLPANLRPETDLPYVAASHDLLLLAVPTQFIRPVLLQIRAHALAETVLVSASKGIEVESLTLLSQLYGEIFGREVCRRICFLSGPSFAREAIRRQPMAVAIAGKNPELVQQVQHLFHLPYFRTYRTDDVVGVELGGALKNVIALAAGVSDGLGYGASARAALITRGLAEIVRLGTRLGGRPETFAGLSGMGDLLLTATSDLSRNRTVGVKLGQGLTLKEITEGTREVAEGVKTAYSVHHLAKKLEVEMPITTAVYDILYEFRSPRTVVGELMERSLKAETE